MKNQRTIKGDIVVEYLQKYPNVYSNTLARMIYEKYPEVFNSKETVRTLVRIYRGANGKNHLDKLSDKSFVREFDMELFNPFGLPTSYADDYPNYRIPFEFNKILIIGDVHIPYHDVNAVSLAIKKGIDEKCKAILLNGDIMDAYQLSYFCKDPRQRHFADELNDLVDFIKIVSKYFKVYYKLGNHEERFISYMRVKAPELIGVPEFDLANIIKSRGIDCDVIYKQKVYAGKLPILHGHELSGKIGSAVNAARSLFLKTNKSAVCNHVHRISEHSDKDIDDKEAACWSIGCLCDMHPEYAVNNKWNQGFGIVEFDKDGSFCFENYRIINGEVLR